jgi:GH25 family lysozyme M1 (1,4-beta-N-acetylmuramidase)
MSVGIDVSDAQGEINWRAVGADDRNISFAFCKATEGTTFQAKSFQANWRGVKELGLVRGAYHFFRMTSAPLDQARNFLDTVKPQRGDLLALDVERNDGKSAASVLDGAEKWVAEVRSKAPDNRLLLYSGHFWRDVLGNPSDNFGLKLWLPAYVEEDRLPSLTPRAWQREGWLIWQYTDSGRIDGIGTNVDVNRCKLSELELRKWAGDVTIEPRWVLLAKWSHGDDHKSSELAGPSKGLKELMEQAAGREIRDKIEKHKDDGHRVMLSVKRLRV